MKNFIKSLFRKVHIHDYNKIIVSMYWSFNTRKCLCECKCGHRIIIEKRHDWVYPHPTASMITNREFESYLTMSPLRSEYYWNAYGFNYAYGRKTWQWLYEIGGKEIWININGIEEFKAKYPNSKYRIAYV